MKVAIVVQRYGLNIAGGAEYHARLIAEHMSKHWDVEVLTTDAVDYVHWKRGNFPSREVLNGIPVKRFKVERERDTIKFGLLQRKIEIDEHTPEEEEQWIDEEGPYAPSLINYIDKSRKNYDLFIFFSYRYYQSLRGIPRVKEKAFLVPTAEHDPVLYFNLTRRLLRLPAGYLYNSWEEKQLIEGIHGVNIPNVVVGVGIEERQVQGGRFSDYVPYMLYIGRIDRNKGAYRLFEYFKLYKRRHPGLKLLLVGKPVIEIPKDPDIVHLGFLPEQEKWEALADALFLINPSHFESLSMILLEAWSISKPVLVYGGCEVLKGQVQRSGGGLYFNDYFEFEEAVEILRNQHELRKTMGEAGYKYYYDNYRWDVIENKYLKLAREVLG